MLRFGLSTAVAFLVCTSAISQEVKFNLPSKAPTISEYSFVGKIGRVLAVKLAVPKGTYVDWCKSKKVFGLTRILDRSDLAAKYQDPSMEVFVSSVPKTYKLIAIAWGDDGSYKGVAFVSLTFVGSGPSPPVPPGPGPKPPDPPGPGPKPGPEPKDKLFPILKKAYAVDGKDAEALKKLTDLYFLAGKEITKTAEYKTVAPLMKLMQKTREKMIGNKLLKLREAIGAHYIAEIKAENLVTKDVILKHDSRGSWKGEFERVAKLLKALQ